MERDLVQELGLVTREVKAQEQQGRPARVVIATRDYDTGIADVWDAITNPERVSRWFLPLSGELRLGGRYQLQGNAGGEIQACVAPRQLALTWEFGKEISWVEVTLSALGAEHTRLELRHCAHVGGAHVGGAHVGGDRWEQFGPGAVGVGWDLTLRGLGRHVSSGAGIAPGAALAWLGSDEGKAFVRGSSDGWCQASIAAGTAAAAARAAAARTTAAYTGEPVAGADAG